MLSLPQDRRGIGTVNDPQNPQARADCVRWRGETSADGVDLLATEAPLAIHVQGVPIAVVMRTPGCDVDLARGFLVTERIVQKVSDIASIRHCTTREGDAAEDSVIQAVLAPDVSFDPQRFRRNFFVGSSCGVCGKASIESAMATAPPLTELCEPLIAPEAIYRLPERLVAAQPVFARTGGLHGAAMFDAGGEALGTREDVGRHNAIDKIIGHVLAQEGTTPAILMVSGRVSFEVVQKALAARVPIIAAISAPTTLAVELAAAAGITLIAFVRGEQCSIYTHPDRVARGPA